MWQHSFHFRDFPFPKRKNIYLTKTWKTAITRDRNNSYVPKRIHCLKYAVVCRMCRNRFLLMISFDTFYCLVSHLPRTKSSRFSLLDYWHCFYRFECHLYCIAKTPINMKQTQSKWTFGENIFIGPEWWIKLLTLHIFPYFCSQQNNKNRFLIRFQYILWC